MSVEDEIERVRRDESSRSCRARTANSPRRSSPTPSSRALRTDLGRACKAAGVPRFNLHDLRHRFISRRLHESLPVHEVARAAGHARASVTLDTYAHVLVDDREVERTSVLP
jgi:integrase